MRGSRGGTKPENIHVRNWTHASRNWKTYTTTRAHHADDPSARPHRSCNCVSGATDRRHIPRAPMACRGRPLRATGAMRDEARKTRRRRPRRGQPSGGRRSPMAPPSPAEWRRSDRTHGTVDWSAFLWIKAGHTSLQQRTTDFGIRHRKRKVWSQSVTIMGHRPVFWSLGCETKFVRRSHRTSQCVIAFAFYSILTSSSDHVRYSAYWEWEQFFWGRRARRDPFSLQGHIEVATGKIRRIPDDHAKRFLSRERAPRLPEAIRTKWDMRATLANKSAAVVYPFVRALSPSHRRVWEGNLWRTVDGISCRRYSFLGAHWSEVF